MPDIEQALVDTASGGASEVTTGAGTVTTDVLVAIGFSNFYDIVLGFGPPTPGTWEDGPTVDMGTNNSKIRAWARQASAGANLVSLDPIVDEETGLVVLRVSGADVDTIFDGAGAGATSGASTPSNHVAPSISPGTDNALLVSAACVNVFDGGGIYTPPGGMTERADFDLPGSAGHGTVATEQLASSGATGTKTFVYDENGVAGAAISLAILSAETDQTLNVGLFTHVTTFPAVTVENQTAQNLAPARLESSAQFFTPTVGLELAVGLFTHITTFHAATLVNQSAQDVAVSLFTHTTTFFNPVIFNEGGSTTEPILDGEGTLADRIMFGLISQGYLVGSLSDRERQRLLAKLALTEPQIFTILDLYDMVDEPQRIAGLEDA